MSRWLVGFGFAVVCACLVLCPPRLAPGAPATDDLHIVLQHVQLNVIGSVSITRDESLLLTGALDGTVVLWERRAGRRLRAFDDFRAPGGSAVPVPRNSVAISPDGKQALYLSSGESGFLGPEDAVLRDLHSGKLIRRFGLLGQRAVAFSPDGEQIAMGTKSGEVRLGKRSGKKKLRVIGTHGGAVTPLAFAADGQSFFTGGADGVVLRWGRDGARLASFAGHPGGVRAFSLGRDGKTLATLAEDETVRIWQVGNPEQAPVVLAPRGAGAPGAPSIHELLLSPGGDQIVLGCADKTIELWDVASKTRLSKQLAGTGPVRALAWLGNGKALFVGGGLSYQILDPKTGQPDRDYRTPLSGAQDFERSALSADGRVLATNNTWRGLVVWDLAKGTARYVDRGRRVRSVALSRNGRMVLTVGADGNVELWDRHSLRTRARYPTKDSRTEHVLLTASDQVVVTGDMGGGVLLFDAATGERLGALTGFTRRIGGLWASASGHRVAAVDDQGATRVWDRKSGRELLSVTASNGFAVLSPDGGRLAVRQGDNVVDVWDVDKQRLLYKIQNDPQHPERWHRGKIHDLAFSADGRRLVTGAAGGRVMLTDAKSGRRIADLGAHRRGVSQVVFAPDGTHVFSHSTDRMMHVWRAPKGGRVLTLTMSIPGDWCAFDGDDRFDAGDVDRITTAHWARGMNTYALGEFQQQFHDPGLIAKQLGFSRIPLRKVRSGVSPPPPPWIEMRPVTPGSLEVEIKATDRGGGVGPIRVYLNGKRVLDDARGGTVAGSTTTQMIDLTNDPRQLPGENHVEVRVWSRDRTTQASRGGFAGAPSGGGDGGGTPKDLYAIVVGLSDYAGDAPGLDLSYAASDAVAFADALRMAAHGQFGEAHTHIHVLTSPGFEGTRPATKESLLAAFDAVKECKSSDVFVLYLAGHGIVKGGDAPDYHYLLQSARSLDLEQLAEGDSVSSSELLDLVLGIDATRRQLLVLDTCASGQVLDDTRALLPELEAEAGIRILAACAPDKESFEHRALEHGALTYSLLHGLSCGCRFRDEVFVDVDELVDFAASMLRTLTDRVVTGQRQQARRLEEGSTRFDLGKLTAEDRRKILLRTPLPFVIHSSFLRTSPPPPIDALNLGYAVDAALQRARIPGQAVRPLLFVDSQQMARTYRLSGVYTVKGKGKKPSVVVEAYVTYDKGDGTTEIVGALSEDGVEGRADKLGDLADRIVERGIEHIRAHHAR